MTARQSVRELMENLERSVAAAKKARAADRARGAETCAAPECGEPAVYLGLCHSHADEEFPDDRGVEVL